MGCLWKSLSAALLCGLFFVPLASADNKKEDDPDQIGNRNVAGGVNFYSIEKEIALGKQLAQEVERQAKLLEDPIVSEYVNRLGQNIVRNSDAKVPFTIKVIDTDQVNAFALPGGFMFVNTGLILKASNEAELAGVMAHEIGHVAARHGTRQATRGEIAQIGMIAASMVVPYSWAGYAGMQGANMAIPLGFLKFSRSMEAEADLLGLEYMYKTGYDPECFVDFFEKIETLERTKPSAVSKLFSTHPMTEDRIKAAQEHIQKLLKAQPEYVIDTSEFQDVKARLAMLVNRRPLDRRDDKRPTLIRRESGKIGDDGSQQGDDSDDRPTLKRRDD